MIRLHGEQRLPLVPPLWPRPPLLRQRLVDVFRRLLGRDDARLFPVGRAQKGLKCRESYVVSRNAVSYRRLGEAPAWAGPGRLCAAELSARRVSRRALRRGSPVARALAEELLEDVRAADGKQRRIVVAEPSEDVDEPPPKRPPPKRGDKWEALFVV